MCAFDIALPFKDEHINNSHLEQRCFLVCTLYRDREYSQFEWKFGLYAFMQCQYAHDVKRKFSHKPKQLFPADHYFIEAVCY